MHCDSFLILVLASFSTKQVSAAEGEDSGVWECKKETVVEGSLGEKVKLVTHVSRLESCIFGDQCCYSIDEEDDCDISDKYKRRNNSKCLEEKTEIVTLGTIIISYVLFLLLGVVLLRCGHIARKDCCCTYRRYTQASAEADGFTFVEKRSRRKTLRGP